MNIGFDLDGVFIDKPPFIPKHFIEWLYVKDKLHLSYHMPSFPEQFIRKATHIPPLRPPIIENIKFILKASKKNTHRHYLISGRFGFLKNATKALIKKHGFKEIFDAMFFNFENQQPHIFKNEVIRKLKIHRYVDDDLPLLKFLAKENPKTKFFWLNEKIKGALEKNIIAITHLRKMFI